MMHMKERSWKWLRSTGRAVKTRGLLTTHAAGLRGMLGWQLLASGFRTSIRATPTTTPALSAPKYGRRITASAPVLSVGKGNEKTAHHVISSINFHGGHCDH